MAKMILYLALNNTQLRQDSLLLRLVQVGPQSFTEYILTLLQRFAQPFELITAKLIREGLSRQEKLPLLRVLRYVPQRCFQLP